MLSPTETLILSLLMERPDGAYASELLHVSEGRLKRGTIYTTLNRMEVDGLLSASEEGQTPSYALSRKRYLPTASGVEKRLEFAKFTGLRAD